MTTLHELAAMLGAATGPSRELDARLWWAFADHSEDDHGLDGEPLWVMAKLWGGSPSSWTWIPQVTSSIDAALALVERLLPGWSWGRDPSGIIRLWKMREGSWLAGPVILKPTTTALDLTKALVAALIAQEKTDEA
jgi:hypothetical protein